MNYLKIIQWALANWKIIAKIISELRELFSEAKPQKRSEFLADAKKENLGALKKVRCMMDECGK